jgi:hypothetical protein
MDTSPAAASAAPNVRRRVRDGKYAQASYMHFTYSHGVSMHTSDDCPVRAAMHSCSALVRAS